MERDQVERAEAAEPAAPSVGTARGEIGEVGRFLLGLIERMDRGPFEITEISEGEMVVFEVRGPAGQALAQGSGRAVDALQLIANQAAARFDENHPRVVVDVEGDAEAREGFLSALALRVAQRARETGRAVALDPMNGRDRRLIHLALRDDEDIATMSRGEGRYRQVIVVPEGAPEYEEARQASSAAARADG
jgi:spoIIIJ-associated protein